MSYKILLVDDSAIVRKMLKKTLELSGIEVDKIIEASNGLEGLNLLKNEWVDLIFLDINMPIMNGMEFMRNLRSDEILSKTPVIVVSTEGSQERKDELYDLDVKAFVRKPVTPEILSETVTSVLGDATNDR